MNQKLEHVLQKAKEVYNQVLDKLNDLSYKLIKEVRHFFGYSCPNKEAEEKLFSYTYNYKAVAAFEDSIKKLKPKKKASKKSSKKPKKRK